MYFHDKTIATTFGYIFLKRRHYRMQPNDNITATVMMLTLGAHTINPEVELKSEQD